MLQSVACETSLRRSEHRNARCSLLLRDSIQERLFLANQSTDRLLKMFLANGTAGWRDTYQIVPPICLAAIDS